MFLGTTKVTVNNKTMMEALQQFLSKRVAADVKIKVTEIKATSNSGYQSEQTYDVTLQEDDGL